MDTIPLTSLTDLQLINPQEENREFLQQGDVLKLHKKNDTSEKDFKITKSPENAGSSAVCYEAEHENTTGTLKEFFPVNSYYIRKCDNQLVLRDENAERLINDYLKPYEKILIRNKSISAFIPYTEIFYGCTDEGEQGTAYIWNPEPLKKTFGTFCKEIHNDIQNKPEEKLYLILSAIKHLTKCIKILHTENLLHRDIKPENFGLTVMDGEVLEKNLCIFDVNTVCSVSDSNIYPVVSDGFTEPETKEDGKRPTNKTDIYSIGATLFYAVTGEKYNYDSEESIENILNNSEFMKVLENIIHPKTKKLIINILNKTLCPRIRRYSCCENLISDIEEALRYFSASNQKNFDKNTYFALQYHVYTNNICKSAEGDNINILILGFGKYGENYLGIILQTLQIPDKKLNVTIISDHADEEKTKYLEKCPKIAEFFNVGNSLADDKESYGNINFITHEFTEDRDSNEKFLKKLKEFHAVFVALGSDRLNRDIAESAVNVFGKKVSAVQEEKTLENYSFLPVYVYDDYRNSVSEDMERMAFNVHLIWEQNLDIDFEEVRKEYRKPYNHDSCVAFVLSMKYKLYALGLDMDKMSVQEISEKYTNHLNNDEDAENTLIYYEHRRWNTEKAVHGYNIFRSLRECIDLCDNKDKFHRLHSCLVKSEKNQILAGWTHEKWDTATNKDLKQLDYLDRMSVRLHKEYLKYAKESDFNPHGDSVRKIIDCIKDDGVVSAAFNELAVNIENICNSEPEQWKLYRGLKNSFSDAVENSEIFDKKRKKDIKNLTKTLDKEFFPIWASRQYVNYKSKDKDLVTGIPFILNYSTKNFFLTVPYNPENLFENLASATVINPSNIIFLAWISKETEAEKIKNSLPYIKNYMKNKKLRARTEFIIGFQEGLKADFTEKIFDIKIKSFCDEADFAEYLEEYLTRRSSGKANFLIEKNKTYLSGLMINFFRKFSSYEFDSVKMQFRKNNCSVVNYINKYSFLTVNDMTALRRSVSLSAGNPEFFGNYKDLWQKYTDNKRAWKILCGKLKEYTKGNEIIAEFKKKPSVTRNTYIWFVPYACKKSLSNILKSLISEEIIEDTSSIVNISASICKVEIHDKYGFKPQYDSILENIDALMLGQITAETDKIHHIIRIWNNSLYVKNLDCKAMDKPVLDLLNYFADEKYLINLNYDSTTKKASFIYSSYPVKDLLTKEGRLLEIFTYHKAMETGFFDDLKSSHEIHWENDTARNELDLIATKGFNSLFIECKAQNELKNDFYTKLKNITDKFGINAKMVMIADTQDTPANQKCIEYGKELDIVTVSDKIENIGEILVEIMKGTYK